MLITPDLHNANKIEKQLSLSLGADVLTPVYSYLSLTEESEYITTEEEYAQTLEPRTERQAIRQKLAEAMNYISRANETLPAGSAFIRRCRIGRSFASTI